MNCLSPGSRLVMVPFQVADPCQVGCAYKDSQIGQLGVVVRAVMILVCASSLDGYECDRQLMLAQYECDNTLVGSRQMALVESGGLFFEHKPALLKKPYSCGTTEFTILICCLQIYLSIFVSFTSKVSQNKVVVNRKLKYSIVAEFSGSWYFTH